eukprot:2250280-Alexandrium_andersonii.AAC.1
MLARACACARASNCSTTDMVLARGAGLHERRTSRHNSSKTRCLLKKARVFMPHASGERVLSAARTDSATLQY